MDPDELQALRRAPEATPHGRRDSTRLLALDNTGIRVQESLDLRPCDLHLDRPPQALLHGKGGKQCWCPLWPETVQALQALRDDTGRSPADSAPWFRNRSGQPLTRLGVRSILRKCARVAAATVPSLAAKRLRPHVLRHAAAPHLLQAKVDLVTISRGLGHANLATTGRYWAVALEAQRAAVQQARPAVTAETETSAWQTDAGVLAWLESL